MAAISLVAFNLADSVGREFSGIKRHLPVALTSSFLAAFSALMFAMDGGAPSIARDMSYAYLLMGLGGLVLIAIFNGGDKKIVTGFNKTIWLMFITTIVALALLSPSYIPEFELQRWSIYTSIALAAGVVAMMILGSPDTSHYGDLLIRAKKRGPSPIPWGIRVAIIIILLVCYGLVSGFLADSAYSVNAQLNISDLLFAAMLSMLACFPLYKIAYRVAFQHSGEFAIDMAVGFTGIFLPAFLLISGLGFVLLDIYTIMGLTMLQIITIAVILVPMIPLFAYPSEKRYAICCAGAFVLFGFQLI